ncbi:tumor necrosis factor receptor superfamily member 13C isoform X1 [Manis javanica]|uniref:tumor necrosis factor receptor superfamily member 13C isoform X1 n=1 Tax=Manis javanica TaxID=9974 RepID=UPI003C6CE306
MVEWLNGGTADRKRRSGCCSWGSGGEWSHPAGGGAGRRGRCPPLPQVSSSGGEAGLSPSWVCGPGSMGRAARSRRGRDGPAPTQCVQAECFDPLVRNCVACRLLRTPEPGPASPPSGSPPPRPPVPSAPRPPSPSPPPAAGASSLVPGTALQPQESVGAGAAAEAEAALPLPALLFGAPALLGLALALVLVCLLSWRWRRRRLRGAAAPEAAVRGQDEPLDNVVLLSSGSFDATAPIWPPPREDPAITPPAHSVPVPATELGSTELVTTKTAGPEQQ